MSKNTLSSARLRKSADLVILPVWMDAKKAKLACAKQEFASLVDFVFTEKDFIGREKHTQLLYCQKGKEPRILLVGLGKEEESSLETLRASYACALKSVPKGIRSINVLLPEMERFAEEAVATAVIEGVLLARYTFDRFKEKAESSALAKITFCTDAPVRVLRRVEIVTEAVNLARDLVNGNADEVHVGAFKTLAHRLAKDHRSIRTTVLDKKALEKEKMGLLLAVGQGAATEPALILLDYQGDPSSEERIALVGKGITFDTGGLNLKVAGSGIETMKCDMGGAAAVVGIIQAAAQLKLKVNLVGALAVAENAIGPKSYKPGDVFRGRTGKTVEITNTDAEGRLILADAIAYVEDHYQPKSLIDFATLTGGVVIALGEEASGLFANDDRLALALEQAGERTFERVWRLPLYPEYRDYLKSPIADIKNSGSRKASSPTGATFLHAFVKTKSWAHLDIAGTAYLSELKPYHPTAATGVGVRLMIDFLEHLR